MVRAESGASQPLGEAGLYTYLALTLHCRFCEVKLP